MNLLIVLAKKGTKCAIWTHMTQDRVQWWVLWTEVRIFLKDFAAGSR
jgi:hypothetical protein